MKIIYQDDTKRFSAIKSYDELIFKCSKAFVIGDSSEFGENLKFYYIDEDGDVISITSEADFQECLLAIEEPRLRLIVAKNIEQAREILAGQSVNRTFMQESMYAPPMSMADTESMLGQSQYSGYGQMRGVGQMQHNRIYQAMAQRQQTLRDSQFFTRPIPTQQRNADVYQPNTQRVSDIPFGNDLSQIRIDSEPVNHNLMQGLMTPKTDTMTIPGRGRIQSVVSIDIADKQTQLENYQPVPTVVAEKIQEEIQPKIKESEVKEDRKNEYGCDAKSLINDHLIPDLKKFLHGEFEKYLDQKKEKREEFIKNKQLEQEKVLHSKIQCSGCDILPIPGIRFKCTVRLNYSLCEDCNLMFQPLPYPMIMVRDSSLFKNDDPTKPLSVVNNVRVLDQSQNSNSIKSPVATHKVNQVIGPLQSKCLNKDSYKHGHSQNPNDKCNIGWVFQNYGKQPWPENIALVQVSGDEIGYNEPYVIKKVIYPNQKTTFFTEFKAPAVPGKYHAFFRLQNGKIPFGDKITIDLSVQDLPQLQADNIFLDDKIDHSKFMIDKISNGEMNKSIEVVDDDKSDGSNNFEIDHDDSDKIELNVADNSEDGPLSNRMVIENPYMNEFPDELQQNLPVNHNFIDELPVVIQPDLIPFTNVHNSLSNPQPQNQSQKIDLDSLKLELSQSLDETDKNKLKYVQKMQELPESSDYLRENLILLMQMGFTDLYKNITNLKLAKNNFDDALSKVLGQ